MITERRHVESIATLINQGKAILFVGEGVSAGTELKRCLSLGGEKVSQFIRLKDLAHLLCQELSLPETSLEEAAERFERRRGRVTLNDDETYSLEFEVAGEVSRETVLPEGTKGVLWVWYFYEDGTDFYNDACMAVVSYDGETFEAYMKYREVFLELPYDYWYLDFEPCKEDYTRVCLEIDDSESVELISSMNWWFGETKAWFSTLIEPWEEWAWQPTYGGWFCVDINDFYPDDTPIPPLLDMPT